MTCDAACVAIYVNYKNNNTGHFYSAAISPTRVSISRYTTHTHTRTHTLTHALTHTHTTHTTVTHTYTHTHTRSHSK